MHHRRAWLAFMVQLARASRLSERACEEAFHSGRWDLHWSRSKSDFVLRPRL